MAVGLHALTGDGALPGGCLSDTVSQALKVQCYFLMQRKKGMKCNLPNTASVVLK